MFYFLYMHKYFIAHLFWEASIKYIGCTSIKIYSRSNSSKGTWGLERRLFPKRIPRIVILSAYRADFLVLCHFGRNKFCNSFFCDIIIMFMRVQESNDLSPQLKNLKIRLEVFVFYTSHISLFQHLVKTIRAFQCLRRSKRYLEFRQEFLLVDSQKYT